jgi:Icc-related predicted phosphoesterase
MRIVCISDTHGHTYPDADMPAGDVLVHAGDVTNNGKRLQMESMSEWFTHLADTKYEHVVFVAGNHDFMLDGFRKENCEYAVNGRLFPHPRVHYLRDSGITIGDVHFWGTPWVDCGDWAFSEENKMHRRAAFNKIPLYTNVLVTHAPPYGIRDVYEGHTCGDPELLAAVDRVRPQVHVFGHIHSGYGMVDYSGVKFVNAAVTTIKPEFGGWGEIVGGQYELGNPPIVIDI